MSALENIEDAEDRAQAQATIARLTQERDEARAALLLIARRAEAMKEPCGMDPETPAAVRNGGLSVISCMAHIAIGTCRGPSALATVVDDLAAATAREEALREDAARYLWLRANRLSPDAGSWFLSLPVYEETDDGPRALDAAIDAARKVPTAAPER